MKEGEHLSVKELLYGLMLRSGNDCAETLAVYCCGSIEKFADLELIDESSSSASQLVIELIKNTKLKLNKLSAEKLFIGVVGDTNRFLYYYTTSKTFDSFLFNFEVAFLYFLLLISASRTRSILVYKAN